MDTKMIPISLAKNYCSNWGVWQAVRELISNAIDTGDYDININEMDSSVNIVSRGGSIPLEYLLMGGGSKTSGDGCIGQHNEGLKIAMLVLAREGLSVNISNGTQAWYPTLEYSELFGQEHLHVEVRENVLSETHSEKVSIHIEGLSFENLEKIKKNYLGDYEDLGETFESSRGTILLDEQFKGCVYVGDIFVAVDSNLKYGYNFNPCEVSLDRDRELVRTYDLQWVTGSMIKEMSFDEDKVEGIAELIHNNSPDTQFIKYEQPSEALKDQCHAKFVEDHGDSVLAESPEEVKKLKMSGYRKVVFLGNEQFTNLVKKSSKYREINTHVKVKTPMDYMNEFKDKYETEMSNEMYDSFNNMFDNVVDSL